MAADKRGPGSGLDFYVTIGGRFGRWRHWDDMRRYGFVSAGHGARYRDAMSRLVEGARVWPVIPVAVGGGHGYVGVGRVTAEAVRVRDFNVEVGGTVVPILTAPLAATDMGERADDPELSEYVARVRWIDARPHEQAFWETGMFHGRQVVGEIRDPFTLQRLRETFGADAGL